MNDIYCIRYATNVSSSSVFCTFNKKRYAYIFFVYCYPASVLFARDANGHYLQFYYRNASFWSSFRQWDALSFSWRGPFWSPNGQGLKNNWICVWSLPSGGNTSSFYACVIILLLFFWVFSLLVSWKHPSCLVL